MRRLSRAVAGLAALLIAGCGDEERQQRSQPPQQQLQQQAMLSDLVLPSLAGPVWRLQDDRVVILNVWATWCAPCRKELPALQILAERLDPAAFAVIGVSIDDNAVLVREYLNQIGIEFPHLFDRGGEVARRLLAVDSLPQTLVFDRQGRLVERALGIRPWDQDGVVAWLTRVYRDGEGPSQKRE